MVSDFQAFAFCFYFTYARMMTVFWDVAPCSLVEVYRRLRCAYCLHHHQTARPNILEDSHLHIRRRKNLKSHHMLE
jgi:hypothetical protein